MLRNYQVSKIKKTTLWVCLVVFILGVLAAIGYGVHEWLKYFGVIHNDNYAKSITITNEGIEDNLIIWMDKDFVEDGDYCALPKFTLKGDNGLDMKSSNAFWYIECEDNIAMPYENLYGKKGNYGFDEGTFYWYYGDLKIGTYDFEITTKYLENNKIITSIYNFTLKYYVN